MANQEALFKVDQGKITITIFRDGETLKTLDPEQLMNAYWDMEIYIALLENSLDKTRKSLAKRFVDWSDDGLDVFAEYIALGMVNERPGWTADPSAAEIVEAIAKEQNP